ncbi:MAG: hypothetical protein M0R46_10935 [Candidatus Muirbacterium halophilum]|nr:hypothetical protein [Candidatus Muirbacterium halophilum]MCK9476429.1 hypothetical protein [Candidatus Muirbacterium halophilum]
MLEVLFTLLIINLIVNIMLLFAYMRLRSIMKDMEIEKYKNCIIEMMRVKSKFEEVSTQRIRELSMKIKEIQEIAEVVDDKILEAEEALSDNYRS